MCFWDNAAFLEPFIEYTKPAYVTFCKGAQ